jgi:hypothetical protein
VYASWACTAGSTILKLGRGACAEALNTYSAQGNRIFVPYFLGLRAELEAKTRSADFALTSIDEGLAISQETGERISSYIGCAATSSWSAIPRNLRLPKRPVAIAQAQKARTFELQAALSLAKLYQSTRRPAEARAALVPALKGFSPTPEFATSILGSDSPVTL